MVRRGKMEERKRECVSTEKREDKGEHEVVLLMVRRGKVTG